MSTTLTLSEQERARAVFESFGGKIGDNKTTTSSTTTPTTTSTTTSTTTLQPQQLIDLLQALDIPANEDEAAALFKFLDVDGNGSIGLDEFLPWYQEAALAAKEQAQEFQNILKSRRTVDTFLTTDIDNQVLYRAIQCAICAPNRRGTEPWRFIKLGKETVAKVAALKAHMTNNNNNNNDSTAHDKDMDTTIQQRWTQIPGWCVVTYPRNPHGNSWQQREDFKSVCCAMENFMLSMWVEGIGSKLTDGEIQRTPEFAELCGVDYEHEKVAGVIWYGFAATGLSGAQPKKRTKGVQDVLEIMP